MKKNFQKLINQLPFQILFVIVLSIVLTPIISKSVVGLFYSASCLFKDALMLFLPAVTFAYMFSSMMKFAKNAPFMLVAILGTIIVSNFLSFTIPYFISKELMSFLDLSGGLNVVTQSESVIAKISLPIPDFWSPKNGMLLGLVLGIFLSLFNQSFVVSFSNYLRDKVTQILNTFFIPLLPLFVFGFFSKLQFDGMVGALFAGYGKVLCIVLPIFVVYLGTCFLIINRFNLKMTKEYLKDSFESFITAFSTMSSIATMPLMFKVSKKHVKNKEYVDFIIPSVINFNMMGDGIIFSTSIVAIFYLFNVPFPDFATFFTFVMYYLIARFSIAGVPGGSALMLAPLTVTYLGFTNEMSSVFITLGILQDCLATLGNVTGNIIYSHLSYNLFGKKIVG